MKKKKSVKKKLFQIIMISTIACVLASCLVSFMAIHSIEKKQIQSSMRFSLHQIMSNFEQGYLNLVNIMQSLEPGGNIGTAVGDFLEEQDNYEKKLKKENLSEKISGILFTNLDVKEIYYKDKESGMILCGSGAAFQKTRDKSYNKRIKQVGDQAFFCIEKNEKQSSQNYRISIVKESQDFGTKVLDIYVEQQIENFGEMDYKLMQIDENMKICFSESEDFKIGEKIEQEWTGDNAWQRFDQNGNHILLSKGKMGFYYAFAVPLSIYNQEISIWQERMLIIMAVSFAIFYSIVIAIYHMIVKPIQKLKQEIEETGKGNFERIEDDIEIKEFHQVLAGINTMREDIKELQEKEKKEEELRKKIEIEKLMYQINPHFVLNTLYSIQWMAQRDGNTEIREFVHNLTAILSYNLGKEKTVSSLRTEVEIAKKYIEIQKQRYDFEVRMEVEEGAYLDAPTIRMLIQPLIENALQHGLGTVGKLELWIFSDPYQNYAVIIVRDYGEGLSREKIRELNQPLGIEEKQKRSGIGLRYVRYMLETFYGENAILNINSTREKGTKITILIPILKEEK